MNHDTYFHHQGIDFHYQLLGDGPALVFCHGLTADLEQAKQTLQGLDGYRLLVWSCRWHGLTGPDCAPQALSFDTFADDLAALLEHLGIDRAIIGGVSMGAGVAARFAASHPQRTAALMLVRPAWTDHPRPQNLLVLEQIADRLDQMPADELLRRFQTDPGIIPAARLEPAFAATVQGQCLAPQARQRAARLRAMVGSSPLRNGEIARLGMPSLVIGNDLDPIHPMHTAQWWAAALGHNAVLRQVPSKSQDLAAHQRAVCLEIGRFLDGL
ncbi:alpha/beta fold hydrolase [Fontivita pretiosa]|uniref:alpha/beta fold hydrolase n=1 Tax=Fontivita pretiosa TaxID=2989684 RepID=UPI003D1701EE